MEPAQLEVWVLVDENGDYVASSSEISLAEIYDDQIGGGNDLGRRLIKIKLTVPLPSPITLTGVVPAESTKATMQVE